MHLKSVEVENFKSFGRRVQVPLLEGFTAVTGPNGSGKSNIADAILFVLGTKSSKAIRAARLTDLIFNGGKKGKGADSCKVSLTFDNKDRTIPLEEDEVTLSRVVRKSKTNKDDYYSHYYVNGRASSNAEFENLLAHARISADSYNIVQQGDVTRIVTMTPLERRRLLDDIAGITSFDDDIERAEKKRGEVEANLERIGIILGEINHQLKVLERDREAAQKYRDLKVELEEVKAKLAWRRGKDARDDLARIADNIARQTLARQECQADLEGLKGKVREAEERLRAAEERMAALGGEEAKQVRAQVEDLRLQVQLAKEQVNHARSEIQDLKEAKQRTQAELAAAQKEQKRLGKEQGEAEKARAKALEALQAKTKALDAVRDAVSKSNSTTGDLNRQLAQLKVEHEKLAAQLHEATLERDRLRERSDRLRQAVAEGEELVKTTEFELKDIGFHLKELRKEADGVGRSGADLRKEHLARKKEEAELTKQLNELEPSIRRLRNEYAHLKAESDAASNVSRGYNRAVNALLEARDTGKLRGIAGTIAELGKTEGKLETAMEVAAGGRMSAIVVEDDGAAAHAIDFLKKHQLGRATFLPLNKMVPGRPAGKPLMAVRDEDSLGFAIDLVKFDERYRNAFWYVFRDTVVMKGLDAARRNMGGVRIVTMGGEVIDAGGAMTGGAEGPQGGVKFGAQAKGDLDKLAKQLRAAVEHQEHLSGQLLELRTAITALEEELKKAGIEGAGRDTRLQDLEAKAKEYEARLRSQEEALAAHAKDLQSAASQLEKQEGLLEKVQGRLRELEQERDAKAKLMLKATSKELAAEMESLTAEAMAAGEQSRDAESKLGTLAKQLELVAQRVGELEARIAEHDAAMAGHQETIDARKGTIEAQEQQLKVLMKVEEEKSGELRGLQEQRDKAYQQRVDLQAKMEALADKIDSLGDLLVSLEGKKPALEAEAQEAEAELAQCTFQVEGEVQEERDVLKQRLRRVEQGIEALGGVNFRALEDFEAQSARKAELEAEVERLNLQREELLKLVEEITGKKKEGLMKVFVEINANFGQVFAKLSDGGMAELRLENEARPFEGGLIIKSQPKGKRVNRLESLSGGEKSLTALAFIFAIQQYAPSPFYVLDEVDMFLDGVNAEKVALVVKENSKHTQFLMVSLRKVTLKEADHVYGVTMTAQQETEVVGEVRIDEIVEEPPPEMPKELAAVKP
jgi:chromosome segregation protein